MVSASTTREASGPPLRRRHRRRHRDRRRGAPLRRHRPHGRAV